MPDWINEISQKAELSEDETRQILTTFNIYPSDTLPSPKNLVLHRLIFSGEKILTNEQKSFEFNRNLEPGIWCIASDDDNLVGKTSILKTILWLLSGDSTKLKPDVYSWIHYARLDASFNNQTFAIEVNKNENELNGSLINYKEEKLKEFNSEAGFKDSICSFMLGELNLKPIPCWHTDQYNKEIGTECYIGWPAYLYALYISGSDLKAIIGEQVMGGIASKLLSLYVGLPWVETLANAQVSLKNYQQKIKSDNRIQENDIKLNKKEIEDLNIQIQSLKNELNKLPNQFNQNISEFKKSFNESKNLYNEIDALKKSKDIAEKELKFAYDAMKDDERFLIDLKETNSFYLFINSLNPEFCPRCDEPIDDTHKKREKTDHKCSVCGKQHSLEEDLENYRLKLKEGEERLKASKKAFEELKKILEKIIEQENQLENIQESHKKTVNKISIENEVEALNKRKELELKISKLEGILEFRSNLKPAETNNNNENETILKVLDLAIKQAENNIKNSQDKFFESLNSEVLNLARDFGIENIENITIRRNATLELLQGGEKTSFSKLEPGEKLRLKIALIIGMLRVANNLGIGRHPGLLLIDSPGSEETCTEDLSIMLNELVKISQEISNLQIVLTSARSKTIKNILPEDKIILAPEGEKYIW